MMLELSRAVQRVLIRPEVSGVVVTQPADNIEETAYFVSISLSDVFQNQNSKPIVFTTCMNPEDPMFDGTKNLLDSIQVACHDVKGDIPTVVVCMNGEIHAASRAQLTPPTRLLPWLLRAGAPSVMSTATMFISAAVH